MTTGAWLMLIATWSVVVFFTARFFWRVLTLPRRVDGDSSNAPRG
jgi:hypothetical protein